MAFVLTARLRLAPPNNMGAVISNIKNKLKNIQTNINVNVNAQSQKNLKNASKNIKEVDKSAKGASRSAKDFGEQMALAGRRFFAFTIATSAVLKFFNALKTGIKDAISFERELVRISQVTGVAVRNLRGLTQEISRLSIAYGVQSAELIKVSRMLAQTGLAAKDVKIALEALAKSELAPTFESITKTGEGSIAIFRQFKKEAGDLESVLGSINAVAGKFAVESGDIITAVRRTGGAFAAAGGSIEDLIALFTSVRATTRESAESIATGFRTIFTRLQRTRTQNFLRNLGIDLRHTTGELEGQFVGPLKAIRALNIALKNLKGTDPRFAQIVEELGGFRQVSKVIPLIQQFDTAQRALSVAQAGQTSLTEDAAKAQQALAVQIQRTKESFAAMIREFTENSTFKQLIQFTLKLANAFVKIAESLEPLLPMLIAFGGLAAGRGIGILAGGIKRKGFGLASGGMVPGSGSRDTVPAMLTPGEFVVRKSSVQAVGAGNLARMNRGGSVQNFAGGGTTHFRPKLTGRGIAEGNVGRKKQALVQKLEFLLTKAQMGTLTAQEEALLNSISAKVTYVQQSRTQRFSKKMGLNLNKGGLVTDKFAGLYLQPSKTNKSEAFDVYPGDVGGSFGSSFGPLAKDGKISTNIQHSALSNKVEAGFEKDIEKVSHAVVNKHAGVFAKQAGMQYKQIALKGIPNIEGIVGGIFEGIIGAISGITDFTDIGKGMDFPRGVSGTADGLFSGSVTNRVADAKRTYNSDSRKRIRSKVVSYIKGINEPEVAGQAGKAPGKKVIGQKQKRFVAAQIRGAQGKSGAVPIANNAARRAAQQLGLITNVSDKSLKWEQLAGASLAGGGLVDSVLAMLTPGEFVFSKKASSRIGLGNLNKINKFADGGPVGMQGGGVVGGLGGAAGIGIGLAALSGLIGSFGNLNESLQKMLNTITSVGAQFALLHAGLGKTTEFFGKFKERGEEATKNIAELTPDLRQRRGALRQSRGRLDKVNTALGQMGLPQSQKEADRRKRIQDKAVSAVDQQEKAVQQQKQIISQNKIELENAKKFGKATKIATTAVAGLTAGLLTLGQALQAAARQDLEEGVGVDARKRFVQGGIASGAGQGVGLGAAAGGVIGLAFGPVGTTIGTIAGGLIGSIAGAAIGGVMADAEAQRIETLRDFNKTGDELNTDLKALIEGRTDVSTQRAAISGFVNLTRERLTSSTTDPESATEIFNKAKENLDGINFYLNEIAKTSKSFDDFIIQAGRDTVDFASDLSGVPTFALDRQFRSLIDDIKKTEERMAAIGEATDDFGARIRTITNVTRAFNDVELSMKQFGSEVDRFVGFAGGSLGATTISNQSARLGRAGEFGDLDKFTTLLRRDVSNNIALGFKTADTGSITVGQKLAQDALAANRAIQRLPEVLIKLRTSREAFEGKGIINSLLKEFESAPKFIRDALFVGAEKIIGSEGEEEKLIEQIKNNLDGVAKQLGSSFQPIFDTLQQVSTLMTAELNRQATLLSKTGALEEGRRKLVLQGLDIEEQAEKLRARIESRPINLSTLGRLERRRTATVGADASVGTISSRLATAQHQLLAAENKLRKEGVQGNTDLIKSIQKYKQEIAKNIQALGFLGNVGARVADKLQELERIEAKRQIKFDVAKQLTAAESLEELTHQARVLSGTMQLGALPDINRIVPSIRGDVISFLEGIGDTPLDALGGQTGTTVLRDTIANQISAIPGVSRSDAEKIALAKTTSEIKLLQVALEGIIRQASAANYTLVLNNATQQKNVINSLDKSFQTFTGELKKILLEQRQSELSREVSEIRGQRGGAVLGRENLQNLLERFGGDRELVTRVGENLDFIASTFEQRQQAVTFGAISGERRHGGFRTLLAGQEAGLVPGQQVDRATFEVARDIMADYIESLVRGGEDARAEARSIFLQRFREQERIVRAQEGIGAGASIEGGIAGGIGAAAAIETARTFEARAITLDHNERTIARLVGDIDVGAVGRSADELRAMFATFEQSDTIAGFNEEIGTVVTNLESRRRQLEDLNVSLGLPRSGSRTVDFVSGLLTRRASGGFIGGSGSGDKVPALLEPGEFVLNRNAVAAVGAGRLGGLNQRFSRFQTGGPVRMQTGGTVPTGGFEAAIRSFGSKIDDLANVVNSLNGLTIDIQARHTVEVIVNGAQVLQNIQPEVKMLVEGETQRAINRMLKDKFPDVGQMN